MLLDAQCPACGTPHEPGQPFCGRCGTALAGTPPRRGASDDLREAEDYPAVALDTAVQGRRSSGVEERKLATVLFADVVGFTSLAERTDPETVARMVDAVFRQMAVVVTEHGGTVDKYMGDCLMAVFGVPVAHEDDAARAVAAALAMSSVGGDLIFSIGINSGEVIATAIGDSGDVTVIGDAVNVAARLEKAAGPGQIFCGSLTAELAGGRAVFIPRQAIILKGKRDPVAVWQATALLPSGAATSPDQGPPLIGRHHELAYLSALFERVCCDGRSEIAVVCGEAGSGKSRLLEELARSTGSRATLVRAVHPPYGDTGGERVVSDVLRQFGPIHDEAVSARVWSIAGHFDESLKDIDAANLPREQLWALSRLLEDQTAAGPLLLLLDDMHWCGESVLGLLRNVGRRLLDLPVFVVVAGRSEPGEWLQNLGAATTIRIGPLGPRESEELAAALVGELPLSDDASEFFVKRSGGNPLYMRELVRMAKGAGALMEERGRYRLSPTVTVPASLQAVLAARLDALPGGLKETFQYVSVFGDGATVAGVAAIAATGNVTPDPFLRDLAAAGLLRVDHEGTYRAAEPLLREVAYEMLPFRVRSRLHRRAASVARTREEQVRHLERAAFFSPEDPDLVGEATSALAAAGMELAEQSRFPEARRLLARAVELGSRDANVLLALARLHEGSPDPEAAGEVLAMVEDDPQTPSTAIERDHIAARMRLFVDPERSEPLLMAVSTRWLQAGDEIKHAWAIANAGVATFSLGRMEEAADRFDRARAIFERKGDRAGAVASSSFLCLARPTDPRVAAWLVEALDFADQTGDRAKQMSALIPLAWHHFVRTMWGGSDQTREAERFALRLTRLADELGSPTMGIQGQSLLALMARYSGRLDRAVEVSAAMATLGAGPGERWLPAAAVFATTVASGGRDAPAPFEPPDTSDPVTLIARQVVGMELFLSGRIDEALVHLMNSRPAGSNLQTEMSGVMTGLALVVSGRSDEARPWLDRAERAATLLHAEPIQRAAAAVRAEMEWDEQRLPMVNSQTVSIGEAIVLRAHAALGDRQCADRLVTAVESLGAPGLLTGIPKSPAQPPNISSVNRPEGV